MPANTANRTTESSGRVRHDHRGNAVWDWSMDTGVFDALSSSALLRRLDVADMMMQGSPGLALSVAGHEAGDGGDPYNSRGAGGCASAQRRSRVR